MTGPILTEEVVLRIRVLAADEAKRAFDEFRKKQSDQTQQSKQQVGEFQRLQTAVRTTTADFRAGIQSTEQYKQRMQQLRQEAVALRAQGIAPAGRELTAYSSIMVQTATRSDQAARVMVSMRNAMATVAAQALGASGRMGTLAASLLPFGAGAAGALAITIGVAAIAKGFDVLGERAKAAQERIEALATANLAFVTQQGGGRGELAAQLYGQDGKPGLIEQETDAEGKIAKLKLQPSLAQRDLLQQAEQELADIRQRIRQIRSEMKRLAGEIATAAAETAAALTDAAARAGMEKLRERRGELLGTLEGFNPGIAGGGPATRARGLAGAAGPIAPRTQLRLNTGDSARLAGIAQSVAAAPFAGGATRGGVDAGGPTGTSAATASNALRVLAQAALTGGNALQVLSAGASNLVQDLLTKTVGGPLAGLLGGLAGGLLSKIFGGGKSNDPVAVRIADIAPKVIEDVSKRITPTLVTNFYGARETAESAAVALRRKHRGRSDTLPRTAVPGSG